jgi:hypothetical protein
MPEEFGVEKTYPFSPILDEARLNAALQFTVEQLDIMSVQLFGSKLPITALKIFAQYPDEYVYLRTLLASKGPEAPFNSDKNFYAENPRTINGHQIKYVGVRVIGKEFPQLSCGDWETDRFEDLKTKFAGSQYVQDLGKDMLQVTHPDFDVVGFIVPPLADSSTVDLTDPAV